MLGWALNLGFAGSGIAEAVVYATRVQSPMSADPTNVLSTITATIAALGAMSDKLAVQGPITTAETNILSTITDTAVAS